MTSIIAMAVSTAIRSAKRRVEVGGVQVIVPLVVPDELRNSPVLGKDPVHDLHGPVSIAGEQLAQWIAERAHRFELGSVVGPGPGVVVAGEERVELASSRQRVGRFRRVHQRHGREQRGIGVMSKNHVDTLHPLPVVS